MLGIGIGISPLIPPSGGGYNAITTAWIAQVIANGGSVTGAEATAISTYTDAIQTGEFDRLWVHGLQNEIAAKTSIVNPTSTMITNVNSTTFTAGKGFTGNGTTMYLDTNYSATIDGVKYTDNNCSYGVYCLSTLIDGAYTPIGARDDDGLKTSLIYPSLGGNQYSYINFLSPDAFSGTTTAQGMISVKRTSSNNIEHYKNGSSLGSFSRTSLGSPAANFGILCYLNESGVASSFFTNTIAISFIGSGSVNYLDFYTDIQALATELGFDV